MPQGGERIMIMTKYKLIQENRALRRKNAELIQALKQKKKDDRENGLSEVAILHAISALRESKRLS